jgi:hypothetical protein
LYVFIKRDEVTELPAELVLTIYYIYAILYLVRLPPHFETIQHLGRYVGPENVMFEPLFLYRGWHPSVIDDYLSRKGFTMLDVEDPKSSIPHNNPAVIIYDEGLSILDHAPNRNQLTPPKGVGIVYLTGVLYRGCQRGHVHGLPHPVEFLEWFLEEKLSFWDPVKGNFRTGSVQYFNATVTPG